MATPDTHELVELAQLLTAEIESDAREHAAVLLAEVLPDTLPVSAARAKAWVRESWLADPAGFPAQLLARMAPVGPEGLRTKLGLKKYLTLVKAAFADQDEDDPALVGSTGRRRTRVALPDEGPELPLADQELEGGATLEETAAGVDPRLLAAVRATLAGEETG